MQSQNEENKKHSIISFLDENHKTFSVLGVFIALSVFAKTIFEGYISVILSFNFLTIVVLIWLELVAKFPSKNEKTTITLSFFEIISTYSAFIFFIIWVKNLLFLFPDAYKAIVFILILALLTFFFSYFIQRFDVFDRLFDRELGVRTKQRYLLFFFVLLMSFYISTLAWKIIEPPLSVVVKSIQKNSKN